MSKIFIDKRLYVGNSKLPGADYGVFSHSFIPAGTLIEVARALKVNSKHIFQKGNILTDYVFNLDNDNCVIAFGFGSLYNHNDDPHITYTVTEGKVYYKTIKDIYPDEEIFVSYGKNWWASRGKKAE